MLDFAKELIDTKTAELELITELVVNTVKAKALFKKGGWVLVNQELGERYMNPNFIMHYGTIYQLLDELKIKVSLNIKDNLATIENLVNNKIGVIAVKYEIDRLAHYLRIVI
jgi:hypothetical protein